MAEQKTICIAGATGLAGAYAVREALRRGHNVHATARDINRAQRLHEFPGAAGRLRLFGAHAERPESFAAPLVGADAVILACFPTPRSGRDGRAISELEPGRAWRDVVAPAKIACREILQIAARTDVAAAVLCSSTASAAPVPPPPVLNELRDVSSLADQRAAGKFMQAQKTAMEQAAQEAADQGGIRLTILLSSMMVAPALLPWHLDGHVLGFLAGLVRGIPGWHQQVPDGAMSLTSPEDLAGCALQACETAQVVGRYFTLSDSWTWARIYQEIAHYVPQSALPVTNGAAPKLPTVYDFSRRDSLGVAFTPIDEMLRRFFASVPTPSGETSPQRVSAE